MSALRCLCCGKPLDGDTDDLENQWHRNCCRRFFGTTVFPKLDLDREALELLAKASVSSGYTVAGVQKKLSLHISNERKQRLTLVGFPAGFILKPQVEEFEHLPEMENMVMTMALRSGIGTVPNAMIKLSDGLAYITKRVDRSIRNGRTEMLAMEDFCQLGERSTEDKYKSSYERCAKIIDRFSSRPKLDNAELYYRLLFCFVTGNSDMHLKNFSLIETSPRSREFVLSPAYDLLPVNLAMSEDREEFALTMNGKKARIGRRDFLSFAKGAGLQEKAAAGMIRRILSFRNMYHELIDGSFLPEEYRERMKTLLNVRMDILEP